MTAVEIDGGMPDLTGDVGGAMKELSVDDDAAADAGADRHADDVASTARGALPPLAEGRTIRVVVERGRQAQLRGDTVAERIILPAEIRCDDDESLLSIERAGSADPYPDEVFSFGIRLGHRVQNDAFDHAINALGHALGAKLRRRGDRAHAVVPAAVLSQSAGEDLGAAEVDADDVARALLRDHREEK